MYIPGPMDLAVIAAAVLVIVVVIKAMRASRRPKD